MISNNYLSGGDALSILNLIHQSLFCRDEEGFRNPLKANTYLTISILILIVIQSAILGISGSLEDMHCNVI